jgi:chemotaxis protein MotB
VAKKQKCPAFENHERWLVSYADMVTLLFAVFVVLYSLNVAGGSSQEKVAGSMQESFNTPLEDIPMDRMTGPAPGGFGIFENMQGDSPDQELNQNPPDSKRLQEVLEQEAEMIRIELEERLYGANRTPDELKPGVERIISIHKLEKGINLRLLARHFFDEGSTKMKPQATKAFDSIAKIVKDLGRPITIEGHTDSLPSGGALTNWEISALRATEAVRYLIRRHNFPATRISAAGYADQRPIAHNGTSEGRQLNRRIEIQIHYDQENSSNAH